ncbi:MAG: lysophospholipid acyltransferase family protein [Paramuribaculum sp.]|nr:lysophospholipid acyltransferase family protein [Paramuribaculum sp.]
MENISNEPVVINGVEVRPYILTSEQIMDMVKPLHNRPKLVRGLMKIFRLDGVNELHLHNHHTPGVPFTSGILKELDITLRVDNEQVLEQISNVPFITVSNHPFGALDGISLINLVGKYRPDFKVMVNMILNHITAMRSNFIAVDALQSDDPKKKAVSMKGIKEAIDQVRSGKPLGFFPAGAVSKVNNRFQLEDREWQPTVVRLIKQLGVPVVPIYFHGSNSWWFNLLGRISWQLRTLRLPAEVFGKRHKTIHISVGQPITPEQIKAHGGSIEQLGQYLKQQTYALRSCK